MSHASILARTGLCLLALAAPSVAGAMQQEHRQPPLAPEVASEATGLPADGRLQPGVPYVGELRASDPRLATDGSLYRVFTINVPPGAHVLEVRLRSQQFVPYLSVGAGVDADCADCSNATPSLYSWTARLSRFVNGGETVSVRVNAMRAAESGRFELDYRLRPRAAHMELELGEVVEGELDPSDHVDKTGRVETWSVRLAAGQNVRIDLQSTDFDPQLRLLDAAGEIVAADDDSGPGKGARIIHLAAVTGVYRIEARAFAYRAPTGDYVLRAGMVAAGADSAQPIPIEVGGRWSGTLAPPLPLDERLREDGDAYDDIGPFRFLSFQANAGETYMIRAESDALDPAVTVGQIGMYGAFNDLGSDDDGGGGLNAELRFQATDGGLYHIRVRNLAQAHGRDFDAATVDVSLTLLPLPVAAGPPAVLQLDRPASGTLSPDGPRTDDDILYADHVIELQAGRRVRFDLSAVDDSDMDAVLEIGRASPDGVEWLAMDDDSGGGFDARLHFLPSASGAHLVRVRGYSAATIGRWRLLARLAPLSAPPRPARLQLGAWRESRLDAEDPTDLSGQPYERFTFQAEAGATYVIEMQSDSLFNVSVGARPAMLPEERYEEVYEVANPRLVYVAQVSGAVQVRTMVYAGDVPSVGLYRIRVQRTDTARPYPPETQTGEPLTPD